MSQSTRSPICPLCGSSRHRPGKSVPAGFSTVICEECGLEHMDPRPTLDELKKIYTEGYYDSWNLQGEQRAVRRLKSRTSEGHLSALEKFIPPGRILDVGCATGFFLDIARQRGWDPFGVELSEFAANEARKLIGADRIHNGMVEECPFEDGSFAAISMMDCIEHVLDINGVVARVARLLAPGGCLLLTTPYVGSLTYRVMGRRWTHYKLEHLQYFGRQSMSRLMQDAGFEFLQLSGAVKHISFDYFAHQFERYRHPLITPITRALHSVTPSAISHLPVPLLLGDMLAIGRKRRP